MQYEKAKKIADRLVEIFSPHCSIIHIAGSIRREKSEVKDIEIVCRPKTEFVSTDLFGNGHQVITPGFTQAINHVAEKIIKGQPDGKMMQIFLKGGTVLDLFMPSQNDYYRQLAIRTGSAEYAAKQIAASWVKKGWCGTTNAGLRMMKDCVERKSGWFCCNMNGTLPPAWQSEEEFFEWAGLAWTEPCKRYA